MTKRLGFVIKHSVWQDVYQNTEKKLFESIELYFKGKVYQLSNPSEFL